MSDAGPQELLDRRTRELHEALEQQAATAEILKVIKTSPADAQPVFETIVQNAVSLCGGLFANVFRFDGELLHFVASHNVGPSYVDLIKSTYPRRPDRSQVAGRVVLAKSVVRLEDALSDPDYDQRFARAIWRRLLGVPMLREGEPIGAIVVGWAEAGPIPKVQEELLKTFADQAVIAIECAAAQRAARVFAATNRHRRCAQGHQFVTRQFGAGIPGDPRERHGNLPDQVRHSEFVREQRFSERCAPQSATAI